MTATIRVRPACSASSGPNSWGQVDIPPVSLYGSAVRSQVRLLAPKYDDVVIDVGGRDTGSLRAALTVSDMLLVPVQPRTFDVWALDQSAALVKEAREINPDLKALAFLNGADAQGRDNAEARKLWRLSMRSRPRTSC